MRYHWLRDRESQNQFNFFWDKGSSNHADYYTKHHPVSYHKSIRKTYVQDKVNIILERMNTFEQNMYTARVC